jgi:hypothetical protein
MVRTGAKALPALCASPLASNVGEPLLTRPHHRSFIFRVTTSDAYAGLVIVRQIVAYLRQLVLPKPRNGHVANAEQLRDLGQRLTLRTTT